MNLMFFSATDFLPLSLPVLGHICVILLLAIFLLILRINLKLSSISDKNSQSASADASSANSVGSTGKAENTPRTPFEEFLNEDPNRRLLGKKEQSTAYRDWRSQKGLNWK
jgi:hypothetical protein